MIKKVISENIGFLSPFIFIIIVCAVVTFPSDNRNENDRWVLYQVKKNILDSIKESRIRSAVDSVDSVRDKVARKLQGYGMNRATSNLGPVGIGYSFKCDDCSNYTTLNEPYIYHFSLSGYTLKENTYENQELNQDLIQSNDPYKKLKYGRYAIGENASDGRILIPISEKSYNRLNWILHILSTIFLAIAFNCIITLPAIVCVNIAKGKPFNNSNISFLRFTGWTLVIYALGSPMVSLLLEQIFSKWIPPYTYYPFWLSIADHKGVLIGGIAALLLAAAFQKGNQIQKEQDLTI